ncbi:hypothetical protein ACFW9I_02645 [[Kitasatospora] papulosa]|uniref:hypothetical protein n=1 Tax=[Kitasatospora] papulosa TaxID=1464011 RepID=UPI0036ADBC92
MTKSRLTLDEHRQLGQRLAAIRNELLRLGTQLTNAYPLAGHEAGPARKLATARTAVDKARCDLEHALFREHPQDGKTTFYHPNNALERQR